MKIDKPKCPDCGELAKGTLEVVSGLALLNFQEDDGRSGRAEYEGETEMDWNSQEPVRTPGGDQVVLECPRGHQWLSGLWVQDRFPDPQEDEDDEDEEGV